MQKFKDFKQLKSLKLKGNKKGSEFVGSYRPNNYGITKITYSDLDCAISLHKGLYRRTIREYVYTIKSAMVDIYGKTFYVKEKDASSYILDLKALRSVRNNSYQAIISELRCYVGHFELTYRKDKKTIPIPINDIRLAYMAMLEHRTDDEILSILNKSKEQL